MYKREIFDIKKGVSNLTSLDLARACANAARAKKAKDIVIMDLQGISIIADYFVICTGASNIQLKAISDHIDEKLAEEENLSPLRIEGQKDARWILMDYGGVVVHIFQEEERLYYNLERLWGDAKFTYFKEQQG
jgi:ribosome-associated protein